MSFEVVWPAKPKLSVLSRGLPLMLVEQGPCLHILSLHLSKSCEVLVTLGQISLYGSVAFYNGETVGDDKCKGVWDRSLIAEC